MFQNVFPTVIEEKEKMQSPMKKVKRYRSMPTLLNTVGHATNKRATFAIIIMNPNGAKVRSFQKIGPLVIGFHVHWYYVLSFAESFCSIQ